MDAGIAYEAGFKPGGYIFPELTSDIQQNVFEFYVALLDKPIGKFPAPDHFIPDTIASVFRHFFKNQKRVAVYICDTADGRSSVRARKFNHWYEWYRGNECSKTDLQMESDETGQRYFISIIIRPDNSDFAEIIISFRNLATGYPK